MGTTSGPYSSVDDQILAYIEAAKTWDKEATLGDFQLRIVASDLVLFNLKTGQSYLINDEDPDFLGYAERFPESRPISTAATESIAHTAASVAARAAKRLQNWFATRQASISSRRRGVTP